jgi:hypothetical protein
MLAGMLRVYSLRVYLSIVKQAVFPLLNPSHRLGGPIYLPFHTGQQLLRVHCFCVRTYVLGPPFTYVWRRALQVARDEPCLVGCSELKILHQRGDDLGP